MSEIVGQPKTLKIINRDIVKNIIKEAGPISKPEIAKITKLSTVTVNKIVESLLEEDIVKISGIGESTGGRRAQLFEYNGDLANVIVLYYYKNSYVGAISNIIGEIKYIRKFEIRTDEFEDIMEDTYRVIDDLIENCGDVEIKAIGLGVPGVVKEGTISDIPNIPSWENINLKDILEKRYKCTICIENDVNLTAIGIYQDKFRDRFKNMTLVYFGDGIGSGLIINEQLFKGATNFAGELGYLETKKHLNCYDEDSKYKGNLERYIYEIKKQMKDNKEDAEKLREALINTLVDGLTNLLCILNPEVLVIQSDELTEKDIEEIKILICKNINRENMPWIIKLQDEMKYSINGVITMCLIETITSYSVSNRGGNK